MRGLSHSPLKTINLTRTIFHDQLPSPHDKTPITSHRRLTCRNSYYNNPTNRTVFVESYEDRCKSDVMVPEVSNESGFVAKREGRSRKGKDRQLVQMIKNCKAATQTNQKRRYISIDPSKLKNTIFFNPTHQLPSPTRLSRRQKVQPRLRKQSKPQQPQPESSKTIHLIQTTQDVKVNPYTKQKYTYLIRQHEDQLAQIRRNTRVRQPINAFMQSYKIAALEISPVKQRVRVEVTRPSPSPHYKTIKEALEMRQNMAETPMLASKIYGNGNGIDPAPWQWGEPSSSIHQHQDYLQ